MFATHFPGLIDETEEASQEIEEAFFLLEENETIFKMFLTLRFWLLEEKLNPALIIELCKEKGLSLEKSLMELTCISIGYFREKDKRISIGKPDDNKSS